MRESFRLITFKVSASICTSRSSTVTSTVFKTPTLTFHSSDDY